MIQNADMLHKHRGYTIQAGLSVLGAESRTTNEAIMTPKPSENAGAPGVHLRGTMDPGYIERVAQGNPSGTQVHLGAPGCPFRT